MFEQLKSSAPGPAMDSKLRILANSFDTKEIPHTPTTMRVSGIEKDADDRPMLIRETEFSDPHTLNCELFENQSAMATILDLSQIQEPGEDHNFLVISPRSFLDEVISVRIDANNLVEHSDRVSLVAHPEIDTKPGDRLWCVEIGDRALDTYNRELFKGFTSMPKSDVDRARVVLMETAFVRGQ